MNALVLKCFAIVFMLIDHIGYFADVSAFRMIGRLAFPLFAFLIANGFKYTKNVYKYALRILVFAVISEFVFDFCFGGGKIVFVDFGGTLPRPKLDNVFFTLFIGLCYLIINKLLKNRMKHHWLVSIPLLLIMAYAATFVSTDYGALGVLWVALFGIFDVAEKKNVIPLMIGSIVLASWRIFTKSVTAALGVSLSHVYFVNAFIQSGGISFMDTIQCLATFAVVFVLLYNGRSGAPKSHALNVALKYAFYAFYPLHILALYLIFR